MTCDPEFLNGLLVGLVLGALIGVQLWVVFFRK